MDQLLDSNLMGIKVKKLSFMSRDLQKIKIFFKKNKRNVKRHKTLNYIKHYLNLYVRFIV